jgi:thymidylate synthase (FAD)
MRIKLLWSTPDPEYQIIRAARICYASEEREDSTLEISGVSTSDDGQMKLTYPVVSVKLGPNDLKLLNTIMTNNHNMCTRFASAAFRIEGISRACSHQMVRIAHFGILQQSQRYVDVSDMEVVFPDVSYAGYDNAKWYETESKKLTAASLKFYKEALSRGILKEDARYDLPEASTTAINMVSNFQGWKHLLKIRLGKHVMKETRDLAAILCLELYKLAPNVFRSDLLKLEELGYIEKAQK